MLVFLFTDIEGSTKLWEQHTAEMGAIIARHDALLQERVSASGGRITKHTGDGVTAAFEGGEPVACALETQVSFEAESWDAIGELRIRIGLHAGEAEWLEGPDSPGGDYFGPPVNCTARIMSAAWGGQILLTPQVISSVPLPPQATHLDLGEHLLKDVSTPQQIYQLVHPDLPQVEFPPPRSLSGHAIGQTVDQEGERLAGLEPEAMAVSLVSATLLPTLLGERPPDSRAFAGNLGVLRDLGAGALAGFLAGVAEQLPQAEPEEIRRQLEAALLARWRADPALRSEGSQLLQAVQGVDAAMAAAASELKGTLAQGLADLGGQLDEFRWVLGDVRETLAEVHSRQELQLAKLDELLQLQREQRPARPPAPLPEAAPPPAFLESEEEPYQPPVFVSREGELAWLKARLDAALAGQGGVVFVTGGPGRGKTALLSEFARRAMDACADLLVASGNCNAYSGVGDPYLPFREVLSMLSGEVEARWVAGIMGTLQARRLWKALPAAVEALLAHGPHVSPALVPGDALLSRAEAACPNAPWLGRLRERVERGLAGADGLQQSHLFQQLSNVLHALSQVHPLLLILDDLQWVDRASAGLLFHLGRRLEGSRILIAGTYRPEEVALGREGERHPLEVILAEFKRSYGDVWLDLAEGDPPEGRRFVDALLETEPNRLGPGFRQTLAERAGDHPLFTVELLRAMQERGDLVPDEAGRWVEGPALDWDLLPARVEAVIGERIERLEADLRDILTVASVEGEGFTAEVVAQVQSLEARALVRRLSGELQHQHRLVRAQGLRQLEARRLALYRFQHHLFQKYLYNHLDEVERAYLHEDVGTVLEALYDEQTDEVAVQLARHFVEAGVTAKAAHYLGRAGELAAERYANEEALAHLSKALEYVPEDTPQRLDLLATRARVYGLVARWEAHRADLEAVLVLAGDLEDDARRCDALVALADCLLDTGTAGCREPAEHAAVIAREMGDPLREGRALCFLGKEDRSAGRFARSRSTLEAALARVQEAGQPAETAACLSTLSLTLSSLGDASAALDAAEQALTLSREAGDGRQEATSLRRVAIIHLDHGQFSAASAAAEAALALHRQIGDRQAECYALNVLGLTLGRLGKHETAAEAFHLMLETAEEIGSKLSIVVAVSNIADSVFAPQGEYEAGLAFLETWLAKARQAEDEILAAQLQLQRTLQLAALGQVELALEVAQSVLPDAGRLLDFGSQIRLLSIVGFCQAELGLFRQARESYQAGIERAEKAGEMEDVVARLIHLAYLAYLEGDQAGLRVAMEEVQRRDVSLPEGFAFAHCRAARMQLVLGEVEQALESSSKSVRPTELRGEHYYCVERFYLTHARVLRALGRGAEADEYLRRAYDRVMLVASKTQDETLRQSWLENVPDNREIVAEWEARQTDS
jgi:predicted ATPase/class 3 adenylate cyclase